jgi:hypothetical protein
MATLANQEEWDRDWPQAEAVPAAWRGVSAEPLLGPDRHRRRAAGLDHHRRRERPGFRARWTWMRSRSLRDQCARNGVTFHHKQNGGFRGKDNGCLVDGVEHKHFPPVEIFPTAQEARDHLERFWSGGMHGKTDLSKFKIVRAKQTTSYVGDDQ